MPGLSNGRANPNDYVLGRGILYFGIHDANGKPSGGYRDLGNCTSFEVSMETQELDHMASRQSVKFVDRQVIISQKMSIAFKLDEINEDNLALWGAGTTASVTGHVGAAITGATDNIDQGSALKGGYWYDIFLTVAGAPATSPYDDRLYDLGAVTVTGGTTPMLHEDYELDTKMGRIFIRPLKSDGTTPGTLVGVSTSAVNVAAGTAATRTEARFFTGQALRGSLKFIQVNPSNSDELREWEFHKVQVKADGTVALIGDAWMEMSFKGVAEKNTAQSTTSPVCTVRTWPAAQGIVAD